MLSELKLGKYNFKMKTLFIVVPVYNEAGNIETLMSAFEDLIDEFPQFNLEIIVVDDGSQDNTTQAIQTYGANLPIQILTHTTNHGPGTAFATAFTHLADKMDDDDWVITIEGDNTSRHELIRTMLRRAQEECYEVIFASPYMYGGGVVNTTALRVILSKIANTFVKEILGLTGIVTVSSFFRLYRASTLRKLQAEYGLGIVEFSGFECMVEMTMKMINLGIKISEVPMVLDTSRRVGKSKMKILRTIRGYLSLYSKRQTWKRNADASVETVRL